MTEPRQSATPGWLAGEEGHRLLGTYLNQQLGDSAAALRLARRMSALHRGSAFGIALTGISIELAQDQASVRALMNRLGITVSRYQQAVRMVTDLAGRVSPTGQLLTRSPLRPTFELETLRLAVERKWTVWTTLRALAEQDHRLDPGRLDALVHRARRQADSLDDLRLDVARAALYPRDSAETVRG
jgi:hypothetical protein